MVFNVIHGVDPKDPGTLTTPFHFDPNIKLASVRIAADPTAPKEFVDSLKSLGANIRELAARPQQGGGGGGGLGVESAAAFDQYVQWKSKELGIDLATIPEPQPGRGVGRGSRTWRRGRSRFSRRRAVRGAGAPGGGGGGGGGRGDAGIRQAWPHSRAGRTAASRADSTS
jgi:hypothetical protein